MQPGGNQCISLAQTHRSRFRNILEMLSVLTGKGLATSNLLQSPTGTFFRMKTTADLEYTQGKYHRGAFHAHFSSSICLQSPLETGHCPQALMWPAAV